MFINTGAAVYRPLIILSIIFLLYGCGDLGPESPYSPDISGDEEWEYVLASDSNYPANVYLTENIEFHPGTVGGERAASSSEYYNDDGTPLDSTKNGACGPPEGSTAVYSSEGDMTVLGSGGSAVWMFDPDWVIVDGEGDDFITFSNHNLLNSDPDGSWNELAHVYVSEDGENWYISSKENYIEHPHPDPDPETGVKPSNDGYTWSAVTDVHGNNHSWANFRKDVEAEAYDSSTGTFEAVTYPNGSSVYVSKYFTPETEYIGGDRFDLANFVLCDSDGEPTDEPWPENGKMRYLKLVDDPSILDGQDWNPDWMTGARIMSAMGINVEAAE